MQESSSGVGRRVLATVASWLRWLRGVDVRPTAGTTLPPVKQAGPGNAPNVSGRTETQVRPSRPQKPPKRSGRPRKGPPVKGTDVTLDEVGRYLQEDGFAYSLREDGTAIEAGFRGRTGTFRLVIFLRDEPPMLGVLVRLPDVVPEPKRPQVAETIVRANYGLSLGCFEMDMSDGEIDFRVSIPMAGADLTHDQLRALLGAAMWTTDRYHRAICRLIYADDLSPAEVIAEVEMADDESGRKTD